MNCSDGPIVRTGTAAPIDTALVPQAARTPDPSRSFLPFRAQTKAVEVCLDQSGLTTENTEFTEKKNFVILSVSEESTFKKGRSLAFARDDNKKRNSVSSVRSVFKNSRATGPALREIPNPLSFPPNSQATCAKNDERSICFPPPLRCHPRESEGPVLVSLDSRFRGNDNNY
jgi:hypothetical protein